MLNIFLNKTDLQYITGDFCHFALAAAEAEDNEWGLIHFLVQKVY